MSRFLTRRGFLEQSGLTALGAAGLYSLLDTIADVPARAAVARLAATAPEQHVVRGLSTIVDNGIAVVVPPLHHQVVSAELAVGRGKRALADARRALEQALRRVEQELERTPRGLSVTLAWGLPYFGRYVVALPGGVRFPDYLPLDVRASEAAGAPVRALLDAIRFPSDPAGLVLERNDVCLLFQSDVQANVADGSRAILGALDGGLRVTSIRRGFVGGGSRTRRSLPKAMALKAGIPGADRIPDTAQLFLGFTSTQRAALGPERIANFETLPGLTDQWPRGYFRHGTTLHLSHVFEDVDRWYDELNFTRRVWAATDLSRAAEFVPEGTQTLPMDASLVQSVEDVARFATDEENGLVGHSASMQPLNRLPAALRDNYGARHARGTAILQRVDFNTLDNPFFWTSRPRLDRWRRSASAGLHFAAFSPTSDLFHRMRAAMDGRYDGTTLPIRPRAMEMGLNGILRSTHRQNFLVPPRRHRSFPLTELL